MSVESSDQGNGHGELPLLLNVQQVAGLTGMSIRTCWRLVSIGELPKPVRVPGVRAARWRRSELVAWVEALQEAQP